MAGYDVTVYDPSSNDAASGLGDGHGRPNFPPNYQAAQANMVWGNDIFVDPARTDSVADPALGFDAPYTKVSEI